MNEIEKDIENLVFELTGSRDNDSSFQYSCIFMREALSEGKPTCKNDVLNKLETFATKYDYLGFSQYSQQLSNAVTTLINNNENDEQMVNFHLAVMDFMLRLSNDTFKVNQLSLLESKLAVDRFACYPEEIPDEVNFDLYQYLQEGSEKYKLPDEDDESSDDEYVEYSSENTDLRVQDSTRLPEYNELFSSFPHPEMVVQEENVVLKTMLGEAEIAKTWLMKNVQHSWWNGENCTISKSTHPSANFGLKWDTFQTDGSPANFLYHDEYKIIRELLLIFASYGGRHECVLKRIKLLFTQISIPSLIQESFASVVNDILQTTEKYYNLKLFCDEILGKYPSQVPLSIRAYAFAVKHICQEFLEKIAEIENVVKQQNTVYTLLMLNNDLKETFRIINFLFEVHKKCGVAEWMQEVPWICTVRLLSVLLSKYQELTSKLFRKILLKIFFKTFQIYAEIMDIWFTEGRLIDWKNEFFIQKSNEDGKYIAFPFSNSKSCSEVTISPLFHRLSIKLLNCCHNIDFLGKLNKIHVLKAEILKEGKLIDHFIDQLKRKMQINVHLGEMTKENSLCENVSVDFKPVDIRICEIPYLLRAFNEQLNVSGTMSTNVEPTSRLHCIWEKRFENFDFSLGGAVLEQVLCNSIAEREAIINRLFRSTVVEDCRFLEHISNLKEVLLMDWNAFSNQLAVHLDERAWIHHNLITVQLYDCVECNTLLSFGDLFRFNIDDEKSMGNFEVNISRIMRAIDGVSVQYEVRWPLNVIFTEEIMNTFYAPLLKLVLKIRFTFSVISRLSFKDLPQTKLYTQKLRRIQLLRHWVVLLLEKLHSYMLLVISEGLSCKAIENNLEMETCSHLRNSYRDYLNKIKHRFFIEGEFVEYFIRALNRLGFLCDEVICLWTKASKLQASDQDVYRSVELYLQCLWYLTKILQKFLKGDSCPLFDLWSDLNHMFQVHKANIPENILSQISV